MALVAAIKERPGAGLLGLPWLRQGSAASRMMSEAVEVVTDYWFDELGFQLLRAPKAIADTASRRSLRRLACA
jgi:hypothetical protein